MNPTRRPRVLLVDDEPPVLSSLTRLLKGSFEVRTAPGVHEAMQVMDGGEEIAVVVSDLRMPGPSGIELLEWSKDRFPLTVRILLTGRADLESTCQAINDGSIFRLLLKPCESELLRGAVEAAARHHETLTAEKVLLEQTLEGCVRALSDVLSLSSPTAFGRALSVRDLARSVANELGRGRGWELDVASQLSQLGAITLPPETCEKLETGVALEDDERQMLERVPEITGQILGHIPRLEGVLDIVRRQQDRFDGDLSLPIEARILRVVLEHGRNEARGLIGEQSIAELRARGNAYDSDCVDALEASIAVEESRGSIVQITLGDLEPGMVFEEGVRTAAGVRLIARGQVTTTGLLHRLQNIAVNVGLDEMLFTVRLPAATNSSPSNDLEATP